MAASPAAPGTRPGFTESMRDELGGQGGGRVAERVVGVRRARGRARPAPRWPPGDPTRAADTAQPREPVENFATGCRCAPRVAGCPSVPTRSAPARPSRGSTTCAPRDRGGGRRARLPRRHRGAPAAAGARRLARPGGRHPARARRDGRPTCPPRWPGVPRAGAADARRDAAAAPRRQRGGAGEHRAGRPGIPVGVRRAPPARWPSGLASTRPACARHPTSSADGWTGAHARRRPDAAPRPGRGRDGDRDGARAGRRVLQDHATDLADLVARSRAVEERAAAGGAGGPRRPGRGRLGRHRHRGRATPTGSADDLRAALQAELDLVLAQHRRRRDWVLGVLRDSTAGLARTSRTGCATDERIAAPTNERTRGCE